MAPDVFIPCIMETFGLIHSNLQTVLSNNDEARIYLSAKDAGYSVQQQALLKGAVINNYYELMSVALMKGVAFTAQFGYCFASQTVGEEGGLL